MLAVSSSKHDASSGIRPSVCPIFFSNVNRARGTYAVWLTRGQHTVRPAHIYVWILVECKIGSAEYYWYVDLSV